MPKEISNYVIIGGAVLAAIVIILVLLVVLMKKSKAYDAKIQEVTSALDKVVDNTATLSNASAETEKMGTQKLDQTNSLEAETELLCNEPENTAPLINIEQEITYIHTNEVI